MHRYCSSRAVGRGTSCTLAALAFASMSTLATAQMSFHVSTTTSIQLGPDLIDDSSIIATGPVGTATGSPIPFFVQGHWQAVAGFVPTDIDGLGRRPGTTPGSAGSLAFSLLSNEGGFLDGDVLGFAPGGGLEVVISESDLLAALGVPNGNLDVDALDFDAQGCLYFSLQSDLPGTALGLIEDGDVLCYQPGFAKVSIHLTEPEIQAMFAIATGSTASIGDIQAIESVGGVIWVVPQAPSSHDGAILSCSFNPTIVVEESEMGLAGAELNALTDATPADEIVTFTMTPLSAAPGDSLDIELRGKPNSVYVALMAGASGWLDFSVRPGFGAWYLDPLDPWLNAILSSSGAAYVLTDSQGNFTGAFDLPTSPVFGTGFGGEDGWSFQVMELPSFETSAPFRVTL